MFLLGLVEGIAKAFASGNDGHLDEEVKGRKHEIGSTRYARGCRKRGHVLRSVPPVRGGH